MLQWLLIVIHRLFYMLTYPFIGITYKTTNGTSNRSYDKLFIELERLKPGANGCPVRVKERNPPYHIFVVKKIENIKDDPEKFEEVKRLTHLIHLNVVKYINCWTESPSNPVLYIQMASYDTSLSQWLTAHTSSQIMEAPIYEWMLQLAKAMEYCHGLKTKDGVVIKHSVTHTDLKPGNIFVYRNRKGGRESVVVGDFGIAYGTALYMSPEQEELFSKMKILSSLRESIAERDVKEYYKEERKKILDDKVTDVYSMGLIFTELLVNRKKKISKYELANVFKSIRKRGDTSTRDNSTVMDQKFLEAASSMWRRQNESSKKSNGQLSDEQFLGKILDAINVEQKESVKLDGQSEDDAFLNDLVANLAPDTSKEAISKDREENMMSKPEVEIEVLERYIEEGSLRQLIFNMTPKEPSRRLTFAQVVNDMELFRNAPN